MSQNRCYLFNLSFSLNNDNNNDSIKQFKQMPLMSANENSVPGSILSSLHA